MKTYEITQYTWDMDHWFILEYEYPKEDFWCCGKYDSREEAEAALKKIKNRTCR